MKRGLIGLLIALLLCGFLAIPASAEGSTVQLRKLTDEDFRPDAVKLRNTEEYKTAVSLLNDGGYLIVDDRLVASGIYEELRISEGIDTGISIVHKPELIYHESLSEGFYVAETDNGLLMRINPTETHNEVFDGYYDIAYEILKEIGIENGMPEDEAFQKIWEFEINHLEYDNDLESHTWVDGLKTGKVVCQGYAELTLVLCRMAGIRCEYIVGETPEGLHAWNQVFLNGEKYIVDITTDDSSNRGMTLMESCTWEIKYSTQNLDMSFRAF